MGESTRSSHSEAIAGVRIKRFLTMTVMKFASELLSLSGSEETRKYIEKTVVDLVKSSFTLSPSDNPSAQAKLFLASLGFSPCEIEWVDDVRLGKVLLGRSRIWKPTDETEKELIKLLLAAVVKGLGYAFLESTVQVSFIEDNLLPPRFKYELQFRAAEDVFAESFHPSEKRAEVTLSANALLSPILGSGVSAQNATRYLLEGTRSVVESHKPEILQREEIQDYPLKILEVLYLELLDDNNLENIGHEIGEQMVKGLRQAFPLLKNHQLLKGIGLLPLEEIDELLFYGSVDICGPGKQGENISFCRFLGHIWAGYASEILEKKFRMTEEPLCASGTGSTCIFTIEKVPSEQIEN